MPAMLSWLRRQWLEAVSVLRKAPICFGLGALFGAGLLLSIVLFICGGSWAWYYVSDPLVDPVVEYFHPGIDFPDSWALGITYWLYFTIALNLACIVFLAAGLWRAHRKTPRDVERPASAPPDRSGGGVREHG